MSLDKQINVTEFGDVDIDKVKTDLEHFDRLLEKPIHRARFDYEEVKGLADTIKMFCRRVVPSLPWYLRKKGLEVLYMCDPIMNRPHLCLRKFAKNRLNKFYRNSQASPQGQGHPRGP